MHALFVSIYIIVCHLSCFIYSAKFSDLDRAKTIRYRTFDSSMLSNDICEFIFIAVAENLRHVHVLCNFDSNINDKTYKTFAEFLKYNRK